MATKKLQDLATSTSPDDGNIFLIEDATATKKITFLNIFNRIKTKLDLKKVATSGKAADLARDANNRAVSDAEKKKWNDYGTTLSTITAYRQNVKPLWKTSRIGNIKQFILSGEAPANWTQEKQFILCYIDKEYAPINTVSSGVALGYNVNAFVDIVADGSVHLTPLGNVTKGDWVSFQICYI